MILISINDIFSVIVAFHSPAKSKNKFWREMSEEYLYAATQPTSQQEPISLVVVSQAGCSWATLKSKLGKFDYNSE